MSRREVLGKRQVAAPLIAQRAAYGALRSAHRRFQPGEGVGVQLAGLRLSGKPQRPAQRQFGHETLVFGFALIAPAASRPGQHCAVRRQRGRQVAPCGHASTVGQRPEWQARRGRELRSLGMTPYQLLLGCRRDGLSVRSARKTPRSEPVWSSADQVAAGQDLNRGLTCRPRLPPDSSRTEPAPIRAVGSSLILRKTRRTCGIGADAC